MGKSGKPNANLPGGKAGKNGKNGEKAKKERKDPEDDDLYQTGGSVLRQTDHRYQGKIALYSKPTTAMTMRAIVLLTVTGPTRESKAAVRKRTSGRA